MCAQRASHVRWNGNYAFGSDTLLARPKLAAQIAATISGWAITEAHLGRALAILVGSTQPAALAMYMAVRSFDAQRDMLMAAVSEVMRPRYARLIKVCLDVIGKGYKDRNQFAHWIWGASSDPNLDALLLVEPKHFWNLAAEQTKFLKAQGISPASIGSSGFPVLINQPMLDHAHIQIYRGGDLEEAHQRMDQNFRIAEGVRLLAGANGAQRRLLYHLLCTEPAIQQALQNMKKNNLPKRRRAAQKSPGKGPKKGA